ncbi:hypothetical protein AAF712_015005 [Marasmius tenuissimus]|uniref:Uncharacterized protein n=1 Tax=Marasmius tenuissimus TaxID=585030 RepID=A0ABR2Z9H1_9AGAR
MVRYRRGRNSFKPRGTPFFLPRTTLSLPLSVRKSCGHFARDPFLAEREMLTYCIHRPDDHAKFPNNIRAIEHMPKRYRTPQGPYNTEAFYNYCRSFEAKDRILIHSRSGLPVCTHSAYSTFKFYSRFVCEEFTRNHHQLPILFMRLVQERSGLFFIDAEIYMEWIVRGLDLPPPSEVGMIGGGDWF